MRPPPGHQAVLPHSGPRLKPAGTINKWRYQASDRRVSLAGSHADMAFQGGG